jgi:hypothetical protein
MSAVPQPGALPKLPVLSSQNPQPAAQPATSSGVELSPGWLATAGVCALSMFYFENKLIPTIGLVISLFNGVSLKDERTVEPVALAPVASTPDASSQPSLAAPQEEAAAPAVRQFMSVAPRARLDMSRLDSTNVLTILRQIQKEAPADAESYMAQVFARFPGFEGMPFEAVELAAAILDRVTAGGSAVSHAAQTSAPSLASRPVTVVKIPAADVAGAAAARGLVASSNGKLNLSAAAGSTDLKSAIRSLGHHEEEPVAATQPSAFGLRPVSARLNGASLPGAKRLQLSAAAAEEGVDFRAQIRRLGAAQSAAAEESEATAPTGVRARASQFSALENVFAKRFN